MLGRAKGFETYKAVVKKKYTEYFTECGNLMRYWGNDPMKYHGKLCPKCMMEKDAEITLYMQGTEETKRREKNDK
jgi:hypothetical protein